MHLFWMADIFTNKIVKYMYMLNIKILWLSKELYFRSKDIFKKGRRGADNETKT